MKREPFLHAPAAVGDNFPSFTADKIFRSYFHAETTRELSALPFSNGSPNLNNSYHGIAEAHTEQDSRSLQPTRSCVFHPSHGCAAERASTPNFSSACISRCGKCTVPPAGGNSRAFICAALALLAQPPITLPAVC